MPLDRSWGWSGTAPDLCAADITTVVRGLSEHVKDLLGQNPSDSQLDAWVHSIEMMRRSFEFARRIHQGVDAWQVVLEYELPLEGGRRPDALIFAGQALFVVEFKQAPGFSLANADQVAAYARDIRDYHSESRDLQVIPVLASTAGIIKRRAFPTIQVAGTPEQLADVLAAHAGVVPAPDLRQWLRGKYAPMPTIVEAARRIFTDEPLPRIWQAESAGVNRSVQVVHALSQRAIADHQKTLILIAGVPGSGKTLAGLRLVYEHEHEGGAAFLSGNGPLVRVLQDALRSTIFVKDLHKAILAYGKRGQIPDQRLIVFDEAQRAWDQAKMEAQHHFPHSEPEILIGAASRGPGGYVLVGLVGDGQEIHGGEEGGLGQWADAVRSSGVSWRICCPPRITGTFRGLDTEGVQDLDLSRSLRSRRAERLHLWVSRLLGEELEAAADVAKEISDQTYPIRLFRNLDDVRRYARERFAGEPTALFGLVASSHAKNLQKLGIDNTWNATRRVRVEQWFNHPLESPYSACQLDQPITEFMCQGLELDLPVICWGNDLMWSGDRWKVTPVRRRFPLRNPDQIVRNTYRVLLTRGRDGLAILVPSDRSFDETAGALVAAGVREGSAAILST